MDSRFRSTNHVWTRHLSGQDHRISHRRRIWNRVDIPNQYVPDCRFAYRSLGRGPSNVTQKRPRSCDRSTKLLQNNRGRLWPRKYSPYDLPILIVVCSAILNNVLAARLAQETDLSPEMRQQIIRASLELPRDLTPAQMETVMNAYVFCPV